MQASGGLPPGFPSALGGLPPGLGVPPTSLAPGGASLASLAGMPPTSSTAALMHMMAQGAGARLPGPGGLPHPAELYADKEKELAKLSALPGPMSGQSDDRNVSYDISIKDLNRGAEINQTITIQQHKYSSIGIQRIFSRMLYILMKELDPFEETLLFWLFPSSPLLILLSI